MFALCAGLATFGMLGAAIGVGIIFAAALQGIKASGKSTIYIPTAAELAEWKKALMPVHKEMESRVGKATVEAAYKATGFVAPK